MGHKAADHGAPAAPPPPAAATPAVTPGLTKAEVEVLLKSAVDQAKHDTDVQVGSLRQELADARRRVADLETAPTTTHTEENHDMSDRTTRHDHNTDGNDDPTVVRHVHSWENGDCEPPPPRSAPRRTTAVVTDEPQMVLVPKREWNWPKALAILGCGGAFVLVLGYAIMSRSSPSIAAKVPEVELQVKGMQDATASAPIPAPVDASKIAADAAKAAVDAMKAAQPAAPPPPPAATSTLPRCLPDCLTRCSAANANKGVDAQIVNSVCAQVDCNPGVGCQ